MGNKAFRDEDGDWNWEAIGYLVISATFAWYAWSAPVLNPLLYVGSLIFSVVGLGLAFHHPHANLGAALAFALVGIYGAFTLSEKFGIRPLIMAAGGAYLSWQSFHRWRQERAALKENHEEKEEPLVSLVLLRRNTAYLEEKVLAGILEEAWGGDYTSGNEETQSGFVVGEKPTFVVRAPLGMFLVHVLDQPYWDDMEGLLKEVPDLRLRHALAQHSAWLSVDFLSPSSEEVTPQVVYPAIARLIYELADEDVLAVMRPDTGQINLWTEGVVELILQPRGADIFHQRITDPVLQVKSDDEDMKAAVQEARTRWPEFAEAFKKRTSEGRFAVKAPITVDDHTEYIWMEVIGLEPDYIHGTLMNAPVALGELVLGSTVEVPISDLNDWVFRPDKNTPPTGLFTDEIISRVERPRSFSEDS